MLPRPEDFEKYPPDVQDKIVAWQDAMVLDESKRQTAESQAQIRWGDRGQLMAAGLVLLCIAAALICVLVGEWPASIAFLAAPLMGLIALLIPSRKPPTRPGSGGE